MRMRIHLKRASKEFQMPGQSMDPKMDKSVFVDDSPAITDCNHSLLKSISRGHVKV